MGGLVVVVVACWRRACANWASKAANCARNAASVDCSVCGSGGDGAVVVVAVVLDVWGVADPDDAVLVCVGVV